MDGVGGYGGRELSYLRWGQRGQYVDLRGGGSNEYIYDDGRLIGKWEPAEFAALIGTVAREIDYKPSQNIEGAFMAHYQGWDEDYTDTLDRPERAEIFCQCVDSRIDSLELTPELQEAVQEWVRQHDD